MPFSHLVELPHAIPGGISFTIDEFDLGPTVFVTDAALETLAPEASSKRERLAIALSRIPQLTRAALRKARPYAGAELIVIEPEDLTGMD